MFKGISILGIGFFTVAPALALTPPPQAVAAGYTTPVLNDTFPTGDVSPNGIGKYNWYVAATGSTYYINSKGLKITSDGTGWGGSLSTVNFGMAESPVLSTPGSIVKNAGHGVAYKFGYFEAEIGVNKTGYDPTGAKSAGQSGGGDWPCFWLTNGTPRNPAGDHAEIDVVETFPQDAFTNPTDGSPTTVASSTIHEWSSTMQNVAQKGYANLAQNFDNGPYIYGLLWTPTKVSTYINNKLIGSVAIGPGTPYPAAAIDYEMVLLGTGYDWPASFHYVHIWQ